MCGIHRARLSPNDPTMQQEGWLYLALATMFYMEFKSMGCAHLRVHEGEGRSDCIRPAPPRSWGRGGRRQLIAPPPVRGEHGHLVLRAGGVHCGVDLSPKITAMLSSSLLSPLFGLACKLLKLEMEKVALFFVVLGLCNIRQSSL